LREARGYALWGRGGGIEKIEQNLLIGKNGENAEMKVQDRRPGQREREKDSGDKLSALSWRFKKKRGKEGRMERELVNLAQRGGVVQLELLKRPTETGYAFRGGQKGGEVEICFWRAGKAELAGQ